MNDPARPEPAEAEATGITTVDLTFDGHTYQIPAAAEDCDIEVLRAFERGAAIGIVEGVLGPQQMAALERRYRAGHDGRFPLRAIEPLCEQIAVALGFKDPGE